MDPRKLLHLTTIIEQGSLAKAAKLLSVSQPALSKSMDRLEAELGMSLLQRGPAGISPTATGELIYAHARLIKDEMELAQGQIKADAGKVRAITVGVLPTLGSSVIPRAIARWRLRHPDTLVRIVEKVQIELLLGLLSCKFNFIVGQTEFFDVFPDGLKQRVLFRDRLCVFARSDHPLFQLEAVNWADLARYPWVCPMVGWPQRNVLEKLMAAEGLNPPAHLVECGSIDFTKSLVESSEHLTMLPSHSVVSNVRDGTIRALSITLPLMKRDIAVIFRERAPLDEASKDLIKQIETLGTELTSLDSPVEKVCL
ncbi:LysR family transcriptional regulator [Variovorax sp. HJSM1_2]|uniref:LysR family transcriptional regulator n=1 Tax=Variovorax sp. HJSM1_2 TaxID=3366263 RepID=UPI003BE79827